MNCFSGSLYRLGNRVIFYQINLIGTASLIYPLIPIIHHPFSADTRRASQPGFLRQFRQNQSRLMAGGNEQTKTSIAIWQLHQYQINIFLMRIGTRQAENYSAPQIAVIIKQFFHDWVYASTGCFQNAGYLKSSATAFQVARKGAGYLKIENHVRAGRAHPTHAGCVC